MRQRGVQAGSDFLNRMFAGDRLALSKLISEVENRGKDHLQVMARVQEQCGRARVIGVTGPPGAGKSTLVDRLIGHFRGERKTVGVVAIDPSSPFSGGAVLGDRIRMQGHAGDDGVFIRSLGSRGSHGGLSRATREVVKLYDAFGMDVVLVETVGVGQTELDIMEIAGTTIVILTPESGDAVQTLKAGILEIADILVVNKADRDRADLMQAELKAMIELGPSGKGWQVPVLKVQALHGIGLEELVTFIEDHGAFLKVSGESIENKMKLLIEEARDILIDELKGRLVAPLQALKKGLSQNPYLAVEKILGRFNLGAKLGAKRWAKLPASTPRRPKSSRRSKTVMRRRSVRR